MLKQKLEPFINKEGCVVLQDESTRDQLQNKANCLEKLFKQIEMALTVPKKRKPTKPTAASKKKRLDVKKQRSEIKRQRGKVDY